MPLLKIDILWDLLLDVGSHFHRFLFLNALATTVNVLTLLSSLWPAGPSRKQGRGISTRKLRQVAPGSHLVFSGASDFFHGFDILSISSYLVCIYHCDLSILRL